MSTQVVTTCDLCPDKTPIPEGQSRRLHIGEGKMPAHDWDLCPKCYGKLLTFMNNPEEPKAKTKKS